MRNLLRASGTITVEMENTELLHELFDFIEQSGERVFGFYRMYLEYSDYGIVLENPRIEGCGVGKIDFMGYGKDGFPETFVNVWNRIKPRFLKKHELVSAMELENFKLSIEHVGDSKDGFLMLCKGKECIVHEAGTLLEESKLEVLYHEIFEMDWENIDHLDNDVEIIDPELMDIDIVPEEWRAMF